MSHWLVLIRLYSVTWICLSVVKYVTHLVVYQLLFLASLELFGRMNSGITSTATLKSAVFLLIKSSNHHRVYIWAGVVPSPLHRDVSPPGVLQG